MYLVTAAEMRDLDKRAVEAGIPALLLMENAGKAVAAETAKLLSRRSPKRRGVKIAVLAGPGRNGGDGLSAARHLSSIGYHVKVVLFGSPDRLPPESKANYGALGSYPVELLATSDDTGADTALTRLDGSSAIVDALLGTGQQGDPRPPISTAVRWAKRERERGVPVVSCDVPTGLDSDSGRLFDPAIEACVTVTMGFPKVGLYAYPGRMHVGRIVVENLGLPDRLLGERFPAKAVFVEDAGDAMPRRGEDHHKGLSGHVTVIAGSVGMAGAAVLAAKAALRAGAGTVSLLCPGQAYGVCASMVPEVMVVPCGQGPVFRSDESSLGVVEDHIERSSCFVIGPGFGRGETQASFLCEILPAICSRGISCVLDADGLHAAGALGGPSYLFGLGGKLILTPHPGELGRLLAVEPQSIGEDRVGSARRSALESGSVVCLKGAGTCVANQSGEVRINTSGDPAMATAGSGDVLSGMIGALVSQGLPLFDAAWLGVFWHGLAGEMSRRIQGSYGVLAGDISDAIPAARRAIERRWRPDPGGRTRCPS